jgi:HEAT repeat protein
MSIGMVRAGLAGAFLLAGGPAAAQSEGDSDAEQQAREQAAAEEAAREAEARERVKTFQAEVRAARESKDVLEAVKALAGCHHRLVLPALGVVLRHTDAYVACDAARAIGEVGAALPDRERPLAVAVLAPFVASERTPPPLAVAAIKALVAVGDRAALPTLVRQLDRKDNAVAAAAVTALGGIKHESSIEPLIKVLAKVDIGAVGRGGDAYLSSGGNGSGRPPGAEAQARIQALLDPCRKALHAITGEAYQSATEWRDWWKDHRATFRVDRPAAAPAGEGDGDDAPGKAD